MTVRESNGTNVVSKLALQTHLYFTDNRLMENPDFAMFCQWPSLHKVISFSTLKENAVDGYNLLMCKQEHTSHLVHLILISPFWLCFCTLFIVCSWADVDYSTPSICYCLIRIVRTTQEWPSKCLTTADISCPVVFLTTASTHRHTVKPWLPS